MNMSEVYIPNQVDQLALNYVHSSGILESDAPRVFPQTAIEFGFVEGMTVAYAVSEIKILRKLCDENHKQLYLRPQNLSSSKAYFDVLNRCDVDGATSPDFLGQTISELEKSYNNVAKRVTNARMGISVKRPPLEHRQIATQYPTVPKETQQFMRFTPGMSLRLGQFKAVHVDAPLYLGGVEMHPPKAYATSIPVHARMGNRFLSTSEFVRLPHKGGRAIPRQEYLLVVSKLQRAPFTDTTDTVFTQPDLRFSSAYDPIAIGKACEDDVHLLSRLRRVKEVERLAACDSKAVQASIRASMTQKVFATSISALGLG